MGFPRHMSFNESRVMIEYRRRRQIMVIDWDRLQYSLEGSGVLVRIAVELDDRPMIKKQPILCAPVAATCVVIGLLIYFLLCNADLDCPPQPTSQCYFKIKRWREAVRIACLTPMRSEWKLTCVRVCNGNPRTSDFAIVANLFPRHQFERTPCLGHGSAGA